MEKAVIANKKSFNYIDGILKTWKSKGITTLAQARNEEEEFRKLKKKWQIINELNISERTYERRKRELIYAVHEELKKLEESNLKNV